MMWDYGGNEKPIKSDSIFGKRFKKGDQTIKQKVHNKNQKLLKLRQKLKYR